VFDGVIKMNRHVNHLLTSYVHGQLSMVQRARVVNHTRTCPQCRAALAREEHLAADLRRELPRLGQTHSTQLAGMWASVWRDVSPMRRYNLSDWLPGVSVVVVMAVALLFVLPLLAGNGVRVGAAPFPARPVSTSSPTPGAAETDEARQVALPEPQATVAFASVAGATPAPEPQATVSPEARYGGTFRQ
jgi:anti-sigma factor RsiW